MEDMVSALCKELELQKDYLNNTPVDTIYFGGGTPSLLSAPQLEKILLAVHENFTVSAHAELTLEANPDDLSLAQLAMLRQQGINRLSIGIQSFDDEILRYLNRAHGAKEALVCIDHARTAGFDNLSIDLIYGIPAKNHDPWKKDLQQAMQLTPGHISSYCLTIEPQTPFGHWLKQGTFTPVSEEYAATQFELLYETLHQHGYEQYEVSNFCLPEGYSRHNSGYWKKTHYLGIGPSAHSYNGISRQYNISHNPKYLQAINAGTIPHTLEVLTRNDMVNEYLLTTLRTKWGTDLNGINSTYGYDIMAVHDVYLSCLVDEKKAIIHNGHLTLTHNGMLLADKISSDLFIIEDI